jgi:hypothetical protein
MKHTKEHYLVMRELAVSDDFKNYYPCLYMIMI